MNQKRFEYYIDSLYEIAIKANNRGELSVVKHVVSGIEDLIRVIEETRLSEKAEAREYATKILKRLKDTVYTGPEM